MSLLCNIQNIYLAFGEKTIFKGAHFEIHHGDRIGLLGGNGRGKSTLFKILTGEIEPDFSTPRFLFDKATGEGDLDKKFSTFHIPQELPLPPSGTSIKDYVFIFYPELTKIHIALKKINQQIEADPTNNKNLHLQEQLYHQFEHMHGWKLQHQYENYLKFFGLNDLERDFLTLSGGEQRKVALGLGLSSPASLLLWDEPTNHLDVDTIKKFERELISSSKTFIVITHDRYLLNNIVDKILHVQHSEIIPYKGTYSDYLDHLATEEKQRLEKTVRLQNIMRRETAWMRQGIKARGTRSKKRVENYHDIQKTISALKAQTHKSTELDLQHSGRQTKNLTQFENVSFGYGKETILENLSLLIAKKEKIGLIGANGSGKSTLLKLIDGSLKPTSGNIKSADQLKVISFHQKREELDPNKSPLELIGDGLDFIHLPNGETRHVISYLEKFLFTAAEIQRPIHTFSGGEKNRIQLAQFMKQSADLWIFDEPTNDLDLETLEILEDELKNYNAAILLVCHDRAFLDNVAEKIWLLHDKSIECFEGGYSQVAPYIEALEMEEEIKEIKETTTSKKEASPIDNQKTKISNKEKMRRKSIGREIENAEQVVMNLEEQIANFDYQNQLASKLTELTAKLEQSQKTLDRLYEEWSELEENS